MYVGRADRRRIRADRRLWAGGLDAAAVEKQGLVQVDTRILKLTIWSA